jgi:SPP1 gp7 family putative phage head morphogenesis protein
MNAIDIALDDFGARKHSPKSAFIRARKVEEGYARNLRKIARHIGDVIRTMWNPDDLDSVQAINDVLARYARAIEPWATSVGNRMITEVAARDYKAWREVSTEMGLLIHRDIHTTPLGMIMQQRLAAQVKLITSLPTEAAERVHKLTIEGISDGTRAKAIAREIMRSGHVTAARANTIARTEVGRTATELTKARAEHVGSTHFTWKSVGDSDVRHDHKILNGKTFAWNDPPIADEKTGTRALPGAIWNCRCWPSPVLPD